MTLSYVRVVLSVELACCRNLLLTCRDLQICGTVKAACPVLEWHTGVAQVWVFERYNLVAYEQFTI